MIKQDEIKLEDIHRNYCTSLGIGNGIMVVFRQVIPEMLGNRLQFVILQIWYELLRP